MGVTQIPSIRAAEVRDLPALIELRDQVAVALLQRGITWNPTSQKPTVTGCFVAEVKSDLVGAMNTERRDRVLHLFDLMVRPQVGSGVGLVMLGWAERYFAGIGGHALSLDCDAQNQRLIQYYCDAGFNLTAERGGLAHFEKLLRR